MVTRKWLLLGVLACGPLLLTGALDRPQGPASPASVPDFLLQPLAAAWVSPVASWTGPELLRAAGDRLDPAKVAWLQTRIALKIRDRELAYDMEATLVRGPNFCARLDMTLFTRGPRTRQLVVSDGVVVAQCFRGGGRPEVVKSLVFPTEGDHLDRRKERLLRDLGCGGPHAVLEEWALQPRQTAPGLWRGRPVLRVEGLLPAGEPNLHLQGTVYLDAKTLWPVRLEKRRPPAPAPFLELEFRDPVLDQPLTHEECGRAFTFQPAPPGK